MANDKPVRDHLVKLLKGGQAHATFDDAVKALPAALRGKRPRGAEHSPWEILEHMRIAQRDILDFSINPQYKTMKWPDDYWPKTPAPPNASSWEKSVKSFRDDLSAVKKLVSDPKNYLFKKIPWGEGQTILREALLVSNHNSHHLGQLIDVRRTLGIWKP